MSTTRVTIKNKWPLRLSLCARNLIRNPNKKQVLTTNEAVETSKAFNCWMLEGGPFNSMWIILSRSAFSAEVSGSDLDSSRSSSSSVSIRLAFRNGVFKFKYSKSRVCLSILNYLKLKLIWFSIYNKKNLL